MSRMYDNDVARGINLPEAASRCNPSTVVFQFDSAPGWYVLPSNSNGTVVLTRYP